MLVSRAYGKFVNEIIPIIKISHEVEDVAEIFARLNKRDTGERS
jgi:hypothetical protein